MARDQRTICLGNVVLHYLTVSAALVFLAQNFASAGEIVIVLTSKDAPYAAAQSLFDLAAYPNLYLKATIRNVRMIAEGGGPFEPFFRKVVDVFGASRIAWGSNFPTSGASLSEIVS